jgi:hypothetical protein
VTDPYPAIASWVIPPRGLAATLEAVQPSGRRGLESGAFWLGVRTDVSAVTAVVIPTGPGVEEREGFWRVTPEVFGAVTSWANPRGLSLLAVCHTHGLGIPARLSRQDRTHSIKAPGVLAIVIGCGGDEPDHTKWGWYVWEDGDYRELSHQERTRRIEIGGADGVTLCRADSTGVQELG